MTHPVGLCLYIIDVVDLSSHITYQRAGYKLNAEAKI